MLRRAWTPLLLLAALTAAGAAPAAAQCPSQVWADEFAGSSLDPDKWSYQIGDGCQESVCGWGNNELQSYQQANATVSAGTLKIEARKQRYRGKQYTSARIRTLGKGDFTYGRFEARIKIPTGQGIWPAFWMMPTDEVYGGWPQSGEIDIMENIGSEPSTVHGTIHFGDPYPDNQSTGASYRLPAGERFTDEFHEFAIEKQAGQIRWLVDDVLFSTQTPADTDPYPWPFDERFHFILNVAVGGNWPGSPDETTVFPQVMEVDHVRVWDGTFPHLAGDGRVDHEEGGVVYSVGNAFAGSTFSWSVPAGASIVSGQGTSSITVDWGSDGGDVSVDVASGCGNETLSMPVAVDPAYVFDFTLESFDDPSPMTLVTATGTLTEVANPDTSGINPSALSGEYVRNSAEQYDVLFWQTAAIADAGDYSSQESRFSMDVRTGAPPGTLVLLQLEDGSSATATNYPTGRHSRYEAYTSVQGQWERLSFQLLDTPDPSTPDGGVDGVVVLFASNSFTGDTYTWDNLDSYAVDGGGTGPGDDPTTVHVAAISVGTQSAGQGNKRGTATVTLADDQGGAVGSATVSGTFSGAFSESASGATAGDGTVTLTTTGTKKGSVTFTFCVDSVSHASLAYDPGANAQTCASL